MKGDLSDAQKRCVVESWNLLLETSKNGQDPGWTLFMRLFDLAPFLKEYFKFEISSKNTQLKLHIQGVLATIDRAVKHLDTWDLVNDELLNLGMMHSMMGVDPTYFKTLGAAFIWTLEKHLGSVFSEEKRQACMIFLGSIASTMEKGM